MKKANCFTNSSLLQYKIGALGWLFLGFGFLFFVVKHHRDVFYLTGSARWIVLSALYGVAVACGLVGAGLWFRGRYSQRSFSIRSMLGFIAILCAGLGVERFFLRDSIHYIQATGRARAGNLDGAEAAIISLPPGMRDEVWYEIAFDAAEAGKSQIAAEALGRASFDVSDTQVQDIAKLASAKLSGNRKRLAFQEFIAHVEQTKARRSGKRGIWAAGRTPTADDD